MVQIRGTLREPGDTWPWLEKCLPLLEAIYGSRYGRDALSQNDIHTSYSLNSCIPLPTPIILPFVIPNIPPNLGSLDYSSYGHHVGRSGAPRITWELLSDEGLQPGGSEKFRDTRDLLGLHK